MQHAAWRESGYERIPSPGGGVGALILGRCALDQRDRSGLDGQVMLIARVYALIDALLGALSLGDIGLSFPPPRTPALVRGPTACCCLEQVSGLVAQRGWRCHVDTVGWR